MIKKTFIGVIIFVIFCGLALYFNNKTDRGGVACTLEAKICPDGSAVGRSGPSCEFAECPSVSSSETAKIGQTILHNGVYITPLKLESDSRCPLDVQCIWAGTVSITARLSSGTITEEKVVSMTEDISFAGKSIKIVNVTPASHSKQTIAQEDYVFEFSVQ